MKESDVLDWVSRNNEVNLDDREIAHVAMCIHHIYRWYFEDYPIGDFLTAVVHNDFGEACFRADDINIKALKIYALYLHNHLPYGWREKALNK